MPWMHCSTPCWLVQYYQCADWRAVCVSPHFVVVLAREGPTYTSKGDIRLWQQLWRLKMRTWLTVYVAPMSIESHRLDWVFVWQKSVYALLMHLEAPY